MTPKPTFQENIAFYVLGMLSSQQLVDCAFAAVEGGLESKSLVLLAGESNPTIAEVGPLFESSLRELKILKPSKADSQLVAAHYYAKAIVDGQLTPYEGARKIWWDISNNIENPSGLLLSFVGLASEIEDLPKRYENDSYDPTPVIEGYKQDIIRAATELLKIDAPCAVTEKK